MYHRLVKLCFFVFAYSHFGTPCLPCFSFLNMARGKAIVYREEVDGEPTRAQRAVVPSQSNCGGRRPQTTSYQKHKQNIDAKGKAKGKCAWRDVGDDVLNEASHVAEL
ncbi:hypothetical protein Scep_004716 [Stephania cephalantha]|uniref:Secreted protein n=1 Tax=Stephania cephalantha TaxID=152367 RepID=A0AAP0KSZ7_9MAGN